MSPSRVALSDVVGGIAVYNADLDGGFVSYASAANNYVVGRLGGGDGVAGVVVCQVAGEGWGGVWGRWGGGSEG